MTEDLQADPGGVKAADSADAPPEPVGSVSKPVSKPVSQPMSEPGSEPTEADLFVAAALTCAGVAGMSAGALGEVRALLPGRSIPGVRVDGGFVGLHVVARYGRPLSEVAAELAQAVAPLLQGRQLRVTVEDILLPGETLNDDPA